VDEMKPHDDSVFHKLSVPKNTRQLLSLLIFDPIFLFFYSETQTRKQAVLKYLCAIPWIILIYGMVYLLACFVIVISDAPLLFSNKFEIIFVNSYRLTNGFVQQLLFTLQAGFLAFIKGLALGLIFGLAASLAGSLAVGLSIGLDFGLAYGIIFGLVNGMVFGLTFGLVVVLAWNLIFLRGYKYPLSCLHILWRLDFYDSPYHRDDRIFVPLWGAERKFRHLAVQSPEDAAKFIIFLREYRPLQRKLADQIAHAAMAGTWQNQPLEFECLNAPTIEDKNFQPSEDWLNKLFKLKQQLIAYRQQIQPSLKQQ
jgi:hypothetical protein